MNFGSENHSSTIFSSSKGKQENYVCSSMWQMMYTSNCRVETYRDQYLSAAPFLLKLIVVHILQQTTTLPFITTCQASQQKLSGPARFHDDGQNHSLLPWDKVQSKNLDIYLPRWCRFLWLCSVLALCLKNLSRLRLRGDPAMKRYEKRKYMQKKSFVHFQS